MCQDPVVKGVDMVVKILRIKNFQNVYYFGSKKNRNHLIRYKLSLRFELMIIRRRK